MTDNRPRHRQTTRPTDRQTSRPTEAPSATPTATSSADRSTVGFFYRKLPRLSFWLNRVTRANYEREMELLDLLCDPSRTGIDVGAKVGMYTYRIRHCSSDVVAFEPIPLFHDMLRAVFDGKRARVEPFALSNVAGTSTLRMPFSPTGRAEFGRSTIHPANLLRHDRIGRVEEIEIETRRLDDYGLASVGFIKIDVEGHELAVLDGAVGTLATHRPNLLIECNDDHQPDGLSRLARWLDAHDYEAWFVDRDQLRGIDRYVRAEHWAKRGIENQICVHRSRPEVVERLRTRVSRRTPAGRASARSRAD